MLPSTRRPIPSVAMVIDTSGSVDDGLLARALAEVDGALRALGVGGQAVSVISCDVAATQPTRVRRARDVRLAGGGGTDMRVGIRAAAALRPRPDLVVVLTDGYTPWPDAPARRRPWWWRCWAASGPAAADAGLGDPGRVPAGVRPSGRHRIVWWIGRR